MLFPFAIQLVPTLALAAVGCVACTPCQRVGTLPIPKDVYFPSRGVQKSSRCQPDVGPFRCVFYKPRCAATDPHCGPVPRTNHDVCYDSTATRHVTSAPSPNAPQCRHDGECVVSHSCDGNHCSHYTLHPIGPEVCEHRSTAGSDSDEDLCGCVDGRCAVFTQ